MVRSVFLPLSETFIYGEVQQMNRYKPYIFSRKRRNKDIFPNKHVFIDPRSHKLEQMLRNGFFQLIHARFAPSGIRMMPLKLRWGVPLVTSFHGCDSPGTERMMKKYKKQLQSLFTVGDCFTVPCEAMKQELIKHGCPEEKIVVHYSGINVDQFPYKERTLPVEGPIRILYVGRLVEKKGANVLIKAFYKVHRVFPRTQLTLIGDGALKNKFKRLVKKLHLEKHVEFMGALPHQEVAKQLERAHLFCLPSMQDHTGNSEGIPNALKEAMACGLPVISTFHSGIPELIEDRHTGYLVPEKDVDGLARRLMELIDNPDSWRQLGRNARMKIESDFNQKVQIVKLERLFDGVIKNYRKKEQERPFFSVVIPTYNRQQYIGKAIKSVLQQSCTDYEVIVVDDGSTDRTAKIVKSFGDKVRYVYQKNRGPSEARNTGIQMARGEYIAFLDSDDLFLPHKLEKNKEYLLAHPDCHFLYSWYYDSIRGRRKRKVRDAKGFNNLNKFRVHLYQRKFTIRTSTAVIRRSCFEKAGLFNPKYRYSQDWDMWLRLAGYYEGHCQNKPLVLYRRHIRKTIPEKKRHLEIRQTARKLYRWNRSTLLHIIGKRRARRSVFTTSQRVRSRKKVFIKRRNRR